MVGTEFFGNFDMASAAIWLFWLFFALLVFYLQTENMREGYPLEDDDGKLAPNQGPFPLPKDKTFILRDGRGELTVPSGARGDRDDLKLERTSVAAGSPYMPTGDPMKDGVGPAAWAPRQNHAELDAHGHLKIQPMSKLDDFSVTAGRDPHGKPVVAGDGEVVGRVIDIWIDVPEQEVRYLTIDLNPEGDGKTCLLPINFCRISKDRVTVRALYSKNFKSIPKTAKKAEITLLEEEKIMAYYGGGTLYADPNRAEPCL